MRLLFIIRDLTAAGGTEKATVSVANGLCERGYEVGILSIGGKDVGKPYFQLDGGIGTAYLEGNAEHQPFWRRNRRRTMLIHSFCEEFRPDVVILSGATRSHFILPAIKGIKSITWDHFSPLYISQITSRSSRRKSVRECDAIVVTNRYDAEIYRNRFGARNVWAIGNMLSFDVPQVSVRDSAQAVHDAPQIPKNIIAVGRLVKVKGFDLLLKAWNSIEDHRGWTLTIVGDGPLRGKLHGLAGKDVLFTGRVSDVTPYYRASSLYVMSSKSEGFSLVVAEALSMGLPVVATACGGGIKEMVQDGVNGRVVPVGNVKALRSAIEELIGDPEGLARMAANAPESVAYLRKDVVLDKWEQILRSL